MRPDTILESLIRGRIAATIASTAVTGISLAGVAGQINEATLIITAILGLVSALASLYSKLREITRSRANDSAK